MANEYGVDGDNDISVRCLFTSQMRDLCGATGVIMSRCNDVIGICFDDSAFAHASSRFDFSIDMINIIEEDATRCA